MYCQTLRRFHIGFAYFDFNNFAGRSVNSRYTVTVVTSRTDSNFFNYTGLIVVHLSEVVFNSADVFIKLSAQARIFAYNGNGLRARAAVKISVFIHPGITASACIPCSRCSKIARLGNKRVPYTLVSATCYTFGGITEFGIFALLDTALVMYAINGSVPFDGACNFAVKADRGRRLILVDGIRVFRFRRKNHGRIRIRRFICFHGFVSITADIGFMIAAVILIASRCKCKTRRHSKRHKNR